ncbi:MAG: hypothetical protein MJ233_04880 [Mycoplasmoidaceae bacterium]|nr:hypothetical protein [Mycoplasmoidaceae bacterium]
MIYAGVITLVFFILFTLIGALAYVDTIGYGLTDLVPFMGGEAKLGYDVGGTVGNCNSLYSFCDLMAN